MIRLDTTTRSLEIILSANTTTNPVYMAASYSDKSASAYTGGTQVGQATSSAAAVTLCSAPGASVVREVDYLSIINRDTAPATITVRLNDNGTTYPVVMKTLGINEQLCYTHAEGWSSDALIVPGGASGDVQFNSAGVFSGGSNVGVDNSDLVLSASATPVTPGTNKVKIFGRKLAGRVLPASVGPSGLDACLQPSLWRQKAARWNVPGNGSTVPGVDGIAAVTSLGTATARNVATTNLMARTRRLGYVSAATAAAFGGHYSGAAQFTVGDGAGLGGFFYSCRFAFSDAAAVAGARAFVGLSSSVAAPSNVEADTLTNSIGVAQLSGDSTQLYIVSGGSSAQASIALGGNFPPMTAAGATNGVVYDLTLFSPPSLNGVVYYRIERVGTAFVTEGTLGPGSLGVTTPANTTLLAHRAWRCNNATLLAVGIDIIGYYIETDY